MNSLPTKLKSLNHAGVVRGYSRMKVRFIITKEEFFSQNLPGKRGKMSDEISAIKKARFYRYNVSAILSQ